MAESMDHAGFVLGSSAANAPVDAQALAGACSDRHAEMPLLPERWYRVAVDTIREEWRPAVN